MSTYIEQAIKFFATEDAKKYITWELIIESAIETHTGHKWALSRELWLIALGRESGKTPSDIIISRLRNVEMTRGVAVQIKTMFSPKINALSEVDIIKDDTDRINGFIYDCEGNIKRHIITPWDDL